MASKNTRFRWNKQLVSDFSRTLTGMVIRWPERIKAKREFRASSITSMWPHRSRGRQTARTQGVEQRPMMLYWADDAEAAGRRTTRYFEMFRSGYRP